MTNWITSIRQSIESMSGGNEMIAGAISLWLLGVGTVLLKTWPMKIWSFIIKHSTTEMSLTTQNKSFYLLLDWLKKQG